ncbi:hypothetical protein GCM10023347_18930 [Streptomyces chumphonensis]|uniref:Uncharacterized protein n=1 Tax=Streptomyces chumphonensis TaxID=1214925 RepID=A0A927ICN1_9ACTN|nr:hypothetical protein [Streptomyces chumphonensis]MBD3931799.1 hypothetical protein [Streptomyces chumphonensis]
MAAGYGLLVAGAGSHGGATALAGVPPAALLGASSGRVVLLDAPPCPSTVAAALRTAAACPGLLLVGVAGMLRLDGPGGKPYVALGGAAGPAADRGLPWAWLASASASRPCGSTTVVVDLAAVEDGVEAAPEREGGRLDVPGAAVLGVVCGPRRTASVGGYSAALAAILRRDGGPVTVEAHEAALTRAALADRPGVRVLRSAAVAAETGRGGWAAPPREHAARPTPARTSSPTVPDAQARRALYSELAAGRYSAAVAMASAQERAALRTGGARSAEALHWLEVRADLARLAGRWADAARGWLTSAERRLQAGAAPADPAVRDAVDRAHHCWHRCGEDGGSSGDARDTKDTRGARDTAFVELGQALAEIRRRVPGPRGAAPDIRRRLADAVTG